MEENKNYFLLISKFASRYSIAEVRQKVTRNRRKKCVQVCWTFLFSWNRKFPFHNHRPIRFSNLRNLSQAHFHSQQQQRQQQTKQHLSVEEFFRSKLLIWQVHSSLPLLVGGAYFVHRTHTWFWSSEDIHPTTIDGSRNNVLYIFMSIFRYRLSTGIQHDLALFTAQMPLLTRSWSRAEKVVLSSCKWSPSLHNGLHAFGRLKLRFSSHHIKSG